MAGPPTEAGRKQLTGGVGRLSDLTTSGEDAEPFVQGWLLLGDGARRAPSATDPRALSESTLDLAASPVAWAVEHAL